MLVGFGSDISTSGPPWFRPDVLVGCTVGLSPLSLLDFDLTDVAIAVGVDATIETRVEDARSFETMPL